ncbi:hypothetical protein D3C87_256010 [compost metagenome]
MFKKRNNKANDHVRLEVVMTKGILIVKNDMKLYDYKKLNEEDQYQILWDNGILIDACIEGHIKKILYAVDNFYIELWCHTLTNKIIWKLSFKQGPLLEKYLKKYSVEVSRNTKEL